jgi:hypothetical protein
VRRSALWLSTVCLILLASCGAGSDTRPASGTIAVEGPSPGFLERIADAPEQVAFAGTRRVFLAYSQADAPAQLQYTERVTSAGDGRFAVDPLTVEVPTLGLAEHELFSILQKNREAYFYRYRDFRIHDLALFLQSYEITDTGASPIVAGRPCVELAIEANDPEGGGYRIAVDPINGLVLRSEELDATGAVIARTEFLDLDLSPDLSEVELHQDLATETLDLDADPSAQLGFPLLAPTLPPHGYTLRAAQKVEVLGRAWARLVYGDGVGQAFFLLSPATQAPGQAGFVPPGQPVAGTVSVLRVGPLVVAQGVLGQHLVIAAGKVAPQVLLRMIDSALP